MKKLLNSDWAFIIIGTLFVIGCIALCFFCPVEFSPIFILCACVVTFEIVTVYSWIRENKKDKLKNT